MIALRRRWPAALAAAVVLAAILARVAAAAHPGLWADEIFSLAMATGHSLEHPAAGADPALGDYVEPREAQSAAAFRRYAEHDAHPAGARRVVRAVLLSDTSPPLYYLLLNPWTRAFGTGDTALRLFSVWWAVLALGLVWCLGAEVGGSRVAWTACLLFAVSPVAMYYSVEGRMYSLLWFLAVALAWLTLRLFREPQRLGLAALWVAAGTAGLLTHYFFAFVWLACLGWLWLHGHRPSRRYVAAMAALTVAAVVPWMLQVPASLARWRVSGTWLEGGLAWPGALGRPFVLAGSLLSGVTLLGGWRRADLLTGAVLLLLAAGLVHRGLAAHLFSEPSRLLWGWLAAACVGPLIFDLVRHTTTVTIPRYALSALPAAVLLAAVAMAQLPRAVHLVALGAVSLAWLPGGRAVTLARVPRPGQPFRVLDARLEAWARPGDVVLVHSIPSGVVGVARYLAGEVPLVSWVPQLGGRRVPADLERLLSGRPRVALARIHDLSASAAPEGWLRAHARLEGRDIFPKSSAEVLYFTPMLGETFPHDGWAAQ